MMAGSEVARRMMIGESIIDRRIVKGNGGATSNEATFAAIIEMTIIGMTTYATGGLSGRTLDDQRNRVASSMIADAPAAATGRSIART